MSIASRRAVACLFLLTVLSSAADAFVPKVGLDLSNGIGSVTVNGRIAIRFRTGNGGLSPEKRAQITASRLAAFVQEGGDPLSVTAAGDRRLARLNAGTLTICVATAAEARAVHGDTLSVASSWASNVRNLLLMAPIALSQGQVVVPLNESRVVRVGGAATGPITATVANGSVASAVVSPEGRFVHVSGLAPGTTDVAITSEGETAILTVNVRKYAGYVPRPPEVQVTGMPCPQMLITYGARQAVQRSAVCEPGAAVEVLSVKGTGTPLASGVSRVVKVEYQLSGDGYITVLGSTDVHLDNAPMVYQEPNALLFSNAPERMERYQVLFTGQTRQDESTRILYHHQNAVGRAARFVVELVNQGCNSATFRVFRGAVPPMKDTVLVGYKAGATFLQNLQDNVSIVETLPANSRLLLVSDRLAPDETASGLLQVSQLTGEPGLLRISALPPGIMDVEAGSIIAASPALVTAFSPQVFPLPSKELDANYAVGSKWAFIPIGRYAIGDGKNEGKLFGNYGVTYRLNVNVTNPTDQRQRVGVYFDPAAGIASGVFIINGKMITTKNAKPPKEVPLIYWSLNPGESKRVRIFTVPLAGSHYPATIVVRS
jgi:hypothetical protein